MSRTAKISQGNYLLVQSLSYKLTLIVLVVAGILLLISSNLPLQQYQSNEFYFFKPNSCLDDLQEGLKTLTSLRDKTDTLKQEFLTYLTENDLDECYLWVLDTLCLMNAENTDKHAPECKPKSELNEKCAKFLPDENKNDQDQDSKDGDKDKDPKGGKNPDEDENDVPNKDGNGESREEANDASPADDNKNKPDSENKGKSNDN